MLVAERVEAVYLDCIFSFEDRTRLFWTVIGPSGMHVGLNPARVGRHLEEIESFLAQFPPNFYKVNGPLAKLQRPFLDRAGNQWTDDVEKVIMLVVLGIAIGRVEMTTVRVGELGLDVYVQII